MYKHAPLGVDLPGQFRICHLRSLLTGRRACPQTRFASKRPRGGSAFGRYGTTTGIAPLNLAMVHPARVVVVANPQTFRARALAIVREAESACKSGGHAWPPRRTTRSPGCCRGHTPWPSGQTATPVYTRPGHGSRGPGRRPDAADPAKAPNSRATSRNAPVSRPASAWSCPSPTTPVGRANPASPIGFPRPADVGSPRSNAAWPSGTPHRPAADSGFGCCGSDPGSSPGMWCTTSSCDSSW